MRENSITQEAIAASLGVSQSSISQWLSGEKTPTLENFLSLSRITGLSLDELAEDFQKSAQACNSQSSRRKRA